MKCTLDWLQMASCHNHYCYYYCYYYYYVDYYLAQAARAQGRACSSGRLCSLLATERASEPKDFSELGNK